MFLTLAEGGDVTTCELTTYEPEMILPIPLRMEELGVKVIMKVSKLPYFLGVGGLGGEVRKDGKLGKAEKEEKKK